MSPVFSYMYILNIWALQCFMRFHSSCLDVSSLDECVQWHLFGRAHGWAKLIGHQLHFRQLVQARAWVKGAAWSHRISIDPLYIYVHIHIYIYYNIWYVNLRKKNGWREEILSGLKTLWVHSNKSTAFPSKPATHKWSLSSGFGNCHRLNARSKIENWRDVTSMKHDETWKS